MKPRPPVTFAEARTFVDFLLGLMSWSYTVFMDLPELADSEWPSTLLPPLVFSSTVCCKNYKILTVKVTN
jgi:hypothetical protein